MFSGPEILKRLTDVEATVASFFESLSNEEFVLRAGDAWTPSEHLQHLCTAVAAVARGFAAPRWLLRLRFGRARVPSREYPVLRDDYRARLARGGRATGTFVPPRRELTSEDIAEARTQLLARWARANARLRAAVQRWTETELERVRLPHPILGRVTAREMLFFAIYHGPHHVEAAKSRLPRFTRVS